MDSGATLVREVGLNHSIVLYWVITCYGWIKGGALGHPDPEAASGVRTYSLRKS